MHSFAFSPTDHNEFYVGSDGGLWKSGDGGISFQNLNSTLSLNLSIGVAVHPTDPLLVFAGAQDTGFKKRRGATLIWDQEADGGDDGQAVVNPLVPSMLFHTGARADIYRRLDNGDTFDKVCGPGYPSGTPPYEAEPDGRMLSYPPFVGNGADATLYLGTWRLWVSTDLCETWFKPAGEFDLTKGNGDVVSAIGVSRSNTNVVYTGSAQGRAMVSTNGGTGWTDISAGLPARYISSITVDPGNSAVAYLTVSGYRSGHIFKTTNTGATWIDLSGNLPDIPTNALLIDPIEPNILYAGTDIGVFVSPSGGNSWYTFNSGMPAAVVNGFAGQSNGLIRLSTYGRGVWELKPPQPCTTGETALCLNGNRFQVAATFQTGDGQSGQAHVVQLTPDTGYLWFFDATNVEAVVKVLNGCALDNNYWVFAGGLTNVNVVLTVTDTKTRLTNTYTNPSNTAFQPVQDTGAFPSCSVSTSASPVVVEDMAKQKANAMKELGTYHAEASSIHTEGGFSAASSCAASTTALCLNNGRFEVSAHFDAGGGNSGAAQVVQLTPDTGYLWFFAASNVESVVKVLNGCALGGHYWVFAGGLTNVNVVITVTDTQTGTQQKYVNPPNTEFKPIQDTGAFASCP
jgi:hypothetical protein